jgi:integral membrane protein (TIGR01906 family)
MQRAPWPAGLLLGVSLALLILLAGPLLLFNPAFTSLLQQRHDVAASFGVPQEDVDRVTGELLVDIWTDGPFDAGFDAQQPLLDERERSHMHDVAVFVRILGGIVLLAAVLAGVTLAWLRREPRRQGRIMLLAAGGIGAVAVVIGLAFAVAFEPTFLLFHAIFFPPGTYLFPTGSDLIRLFPQGFWFDASLAAGGAVLLSALVVSVVGWLRWRSVARA